MVEATYALYDRFPIACMGDDPMTDSIIVQTDDPERTRLELQASYDGYVQLWDVR